MARDPKQCFLEHLGGRHLTDIWETTWRHLRNIWDLGEIWEASGRHLGGIWEASGEASGGTWGHGRPDAALEAFCAKTIVFFCKSSRDRPFRLSFGGVTLTISAACHQKERASCARKVPTHLWISLPRRQNPCRGKLYLGNMCNQINSRTGPA